MLSATFKYFSLFCSIYLVFLFLLSFLKVFCLLSLYMDCSLSLKLFIFSFPDFLLLSTHFLLRIRDIYYISFVAVLLVYLWHFFSIIFSFNLVPFYYRYFYCLVKENKQSTNQRERNTQHKLSICNSFFFYYCYCYYYYCHYFLILIVVIVTFDSRWRFDGNRKRKNT